VRISTHSDWSSPEVLPTISGKPWDSDLLPQVALDGTVYTTITNNPTKRGFSGADIYVISSKDRGAKPATAAAGREGHLGPGLPEHHLPRRDRQYVRRRNAQGRQRVSAVRLVRRRRKRPLERLCDRLVRRRCVSTFNKASEDPTFSKQQIVVSIATPSP
jgi:hypothetical protein